MQNFDKCYKKSNICDFYDNYSKETQNVDEFIKLLENIHYFGNKHFDLYFTKQIVNRKDLLVILNNLDIIIEDYIENLYFLRFFSENVKNEVKVKWKKYIKTMRVFEKTQENSDIIVSNDWKSYLSLFLKYSQAESNIWETFSVNSLFLNISVCLLKFFDIKEKNSILHQYIKFLFNNLDIKKRIDMVKIESNYNVFMSYVEKESNIYNLTILKDLSDEKQEELYKYLFNNIGFF
jgi:hypothetical protein